MSDKPEVPVAADAEEVEEIDMTEESAAGDSGKVSAELLTNPALIAAVQDKLNGMVGKNSGYIDMLPKVVKRRIKALKKLQAEAVASEARFYEEVHELECKYASTYQALFDRRRDILLGSIEPTDSDCEWPSDEEDDDEKEEGGEEKKDDDAQKTADELAEKVKQQLGMDEDVKGVPEFWLTIFKNVEMLAEMVQEHDEAALKKLQDIRVQFQSAPSAGFTLEFVFAENDYFTDEVLTKHYDLRLEPDDKDPLSYEGPEIVKCRGHTINWKPGKNLTVKTVKKKQKHKGRGQTRTVTKTVPNDSFFNFFAPPEASEDDEDDDETEALLATDYEIGHFLRERVVPRAVLYFTGEALEEDDDDDEDFDEDDDGEDGDEDENDPDYDPNAAGADKPGDCKNQ